MDSCMTTDHNKTLKEPVDVSKGENTLSETKRKVKKAAAMIK